jgi:ribosomal protein S18 acetylase RimI-like enzyme
MQEYEARNLVVEETMSTTPCTIRSMRRDEVNFAVDLAASEGWNPGLHDAECFYAADPEGFFIGEADGKPVGCISGVSYPEGFGFIGLYIVLPERRGQGFGQRIWSHALDALAGRLVGLDSVLAQQENYKKSGFHTAYRNVRFQGVGGGERAQGVNALRDVPLEPVLAYDRLCFPSSRVSFLKAWLDQPDAFGYAVPGESGLAGWGLIRRCMQGWKIGPLFADNARVAEALYLALSAHAPGEPVFLDVPEPNAPGLELVKRHAMTPVFETARMYNGPAPDIQLSKVFGVTTFELG